MANSLILACPVCGATDEHRVEKTIAKPLELPMPAIGAIDCKNPHGGTYRVRMRICALNGCKFDSIEMDRDSLTALIAFSSKNFERLSRVRKLVTNLKAEVNAIEEVVGVVKNRKQQGGGKGQTGKQ